MLADPQTVAYAGTNYTMPKTSIGPTQSVFSDSSANQLVLTTKQNVSANRFRREVRISQSLVYTDPITGANKPQGVSAYLVIDEPRAASFTDADILELVKSLKAWLTDANVNKVLAGEF